MIYNNIQEYIDLVERIISRAKAKGNNHTGTFDTKFSMPVIAYNAKRFFEQNGYSVELRECKSCKSFDLIFSWENK